MITRTQPDQIDDQLILHLHAPNSYSPELLFLQSLCREDTRLGPISLSAMQIYVGLSVELALFSMVKLSTAIMVERGALRPFIEIPAGYSTASSV